MRMVQALSEEVMDGGDFGGIVEAGFKSVEHLVQTVEESAEGGGRTCFERSGCKSVLKGFGCGYM